jgi:hypothetical protein
MYWWPGLLVLSEIAGIPGKRRTRQRIKADGGVAQFDAP